MTLAALTVNRGAVAVASRVGGALLTFIAQVTVARLAGIEEYGAFAFVVGAINLGVAFSKLGLDTTALRYEAVYIGRADAARFHGFRRFSDASVLGGGIIVALVTAWLLAASDSWADRDSHLLSLVLLVAVPCIGLSALRISGLLAYGRVLLAYLPELLLRPVTIIAGALLIFGFSGQLSAERALIVFAVATALSLIVSTASVRTTTPATVASRGARSYDLGGWCDTGATFLVSTVGFFLLTQADVLVVGALLGDAAVGAYAAASRCAVYLTLFLVAIQRTVAPMISEHFQKDDRSGTQHILDVTASVAGVTGLAGGVFVFVFAGPILNLFGDDFGGATTLLRILAAGQVVNCLTGASGVTMNMTGHHRAALVIQLVFSGIGVGGSILAASYAGVEGVAWVTATTIALWNLVSAGYVRSKTGLRTWFRPQSAVTALNAIRHRHALY